MFNLRMVIQLLRVPQWSKNAVVFAALVFGDPTVSHPIIRTLAAFIAFCLVSSAGYIVNDLLDVEKDRLHPSKRKRPIPAGKVSHRAANAIAALLVILGIAVSLAVNIELMLVILAYLIVTIAYSLWLKRVVLLDVFVIAFGFLLRGFAGAAAVEVPVSAWLMLCTILLALFLGFGKRRSELVRLGETASDHRSVLAGYSVSFLDQLISITVACTIMAYSFYSFSAESVPGNGIMMLTVPFVMFAMFRYLMLVMRKGEGGSPEMLLWRDKPLLASVVAWSIVVLVIMVWIV